MNTIVPVSGKDLKYDSRHADYYLIAHCHNQTAEVVNDLTSKVSTLEESVKTLNRRVEILEKIALENDGATPNKAAKMVSKL